MASRTTGSLSGAVSEVGQYKHDCSAEAMIIKEPSFIKNISSSEMLKDDGSASGVPDYRVIIKGPKTITAKLKEKVSGSGRGSGRGSNSNSNSGRGSGRGRGSDRGDPSSAPPRDMKPHFAGRCCGIPYPFRSPEAHEITNRSDSICSNYSPGRAWQSD